MANLVSRSNGAEHPDRLRALNSQHTAEVFGIDVCWNGKGQDGNRSASEIQGVLSGKQYWGNHFWTMGYCVDTISLDMEKIQAYVRNQDKKDQQIEQCELGL